MDKITKEYLESQIKEIEYTTFITKGGKILRWCIFTMNNNFAVIGRPSATINPLNDDEVIAYNNTFDRLWELEGYLLASKS